MSDAKYYPPMTGAYTGGRGFRGGGRGGRGRGRAARERRKQEKPPPGPPPKHPLVKLGEAVKELMERDERVGFPRHRPHVEQQETFGWLFAAQKILLHHIMREDTRVVVQIGAYLGKTTLFLRERSPQALLFVIDEWDNEGLKAEPKLNKNWENIDLFERVPFYEMFLYNLWEHRAQLDDQGRMTGVVPLRMGWREGLEVLKDLGVRPDALYWEGYPLTTTEVEELLQHCQRTFRGVTVVGDGWSHPEVREGVLKSRELFGHRPFVELGKCWTYARIKEHELSEPREIYYHQTENKAGQSVLAVEEVVEEQDEEGKKVVKKVTLGQKSFGDLLSSFKAVAAAWKEQEAEDRAQRRREEEEQRRRREEEDEERRRKEREEEDRKRRMRREDEDDRDGRRHNKRSRSKERPGGGEQEKKKHKKKKKKRRHGEDGDYYQDEEEEQQQQEGEESGPRDFIGLLPTPTPEQLAAIAAKKEAQRQQELQRQREMEEAANDERGWL